MDEPPKTPKNRINQAKVPVCLGCAASFLHQSNFTKSLLWLGVGFFRRFWRFVHGTRDNLTFLQCAVDPDLSIEKSIECIDDAF